MKQKTWDRWIGKKVRRKNDGPNGIIGVVAEGGKFNTWWVVEWADGSKKSYPERLLVIVPESSLSS